MIWYVRYNTGKIVFTEHGGQSGFIKEAELPEKEKSIAKLTTQISEMEMKKTGGFGSSTAMSSSL